MPTKARDQGYKPHQDHVTERGMNSLNHYNLVKILDAKAAVEKELEKLEKILAWQLTKVRNKKEVIDEARNEGRKVHFASLVDLCHLTNSELEPRYQKKEVEWYSEVTL